MRLSLKLSINIPPKANSPIINGKTYTINTNNKDLYYLVNDKEDKNKGHLLMMYIRIFIKHVYA